MDWGKANRMSKVMKSDGHCFYLAMDHGYFQGPTTNLENVGKAATPLLEFVDALYVTRGILRTQIDPKMDNPVILRISGGASMVGEDLANEGIVTDIDEILRLNVSAVGLSIFIGSQFENQTLLNLGKVVNMCQPYGIPVMAVTAVGREMEKREARYLALACRICAETGADVVKTYYCDNFEHVVNGCPVPVVLAGGPKTDNDLEVLEFVYNSMQAGAAGVNLGRNIWQNKYPRAMARALQAIIHEGAKPKEAMDLFDGWASDAK
ncbi:MAG: 3-hydroxy-5-phosphonooxypentane-2,4-dione thiolase [Anaerolineaceae bacterium]